MTLRGVARAVGIVIVGRSMLRPQRGVRVGLLGCCLLVAGQPVAVLAGPGPLPLHACDGQCGHAGSEVTQKGKGFSALFSGITRTGSGVRVGFTDYRACDGELVKVLYWDFTTSQQASRAFSGELARAAEILNRGSKTNQKGDIVGERAEVVFPPREAGGLRRAIVWTDGLKFHEMKSRCLCDALELEKTYRY